jgi:hypothetical protein
VNGIYPPAAQFSCTVLTVYAVADFLWRFEPPGFIFVDLRRDSRPVWIPAGLGADAVLCARQPSILPLRIAASYDDREAFPKMTRSTSLLLALVFVLTMAVSVLVGQQMQRSKFEKYLQPTTVTPMQLGVLEVNLELIRDSVPSTSMSGIGIPTMDYEPSCRCFVATATVFDADLMKKPFSEMHNTLMMSAMFVSMELKREFSEISDWKADRPDLDFKMTFYQLAKGGPAGISRKLLAEYSEGKLSFK